MEEGGRRERTRDSSVRTQPSVTGGRGHKPRRATSLQKLEKARKQVFPSKLPERKAVLPRP